MDYKLPAETLALLKKDTKLPVIVAQTTDYNRFKYLESNRATDANNKRELMGSMEKHPELAAYEPVLVNEHWFIIDGQHRFEDNRDMGMPVTYMMAPGLTIKHTRQINITGRRWIPSDFASSYAKEGIESYKIYNAVRNEYGYEHSIISLFLAGKRKNSGMAKQFINGGFEIGNEKLARIHLTRLDQIREMMIESGYDLSLRNTQARGSRITKKFPTAFAYALQEAFYQDGFDWPHFIARFEERHRHIMYASGRKKDYLRMIEDIYNYNLKGNALRLW